jgi:hypothetical protein
LRNSFGQTDRIVFNRNTILVKPRRSVVLIHGALVKRWYYLQPDKVLKMSNVTQPLAADYRLVAIFLGEPNLTVSCNYAAKKFTHI